MNSPWGKMPVGGAEPPADDITFKQLEVSGRISDILDTLPEGDPQLASMMLAMEVQLCEYLTNTISPEGRTREGVFKALSCLTDVTVKIRTDVMARLQLERTPDIAFRVLEIMSLAKELNMDQEDNIPSILFSCFASEYVELLETREGSEEDLRKHLTAALLEFANEVDRAFVKRKAK